MTCAVVAFVVMAFGIPLILIIAESLENGVREAVNLSKLSSNWHSMHACPGQKMRISDRLFAG